MSADADHLANLIRSTPARFPNPGGTTATLVLDTTARLFGVDVDDILGGSHVRRHVEPRMVAMAVLRATSTMSYPEIGRVFNRDHTTVISAVERVASTPGLLAWASAVDLELTTPEPAHRRAGTCRRTHHPRPGGTTR